MGPTLEAENRGKVSLALGQGSLGNGGKLGSRLYNTQNRRPL
jgi:hypothetical protein